MVGESLAIIAVLLVMIIMFAKAGKHTSCMFALPLIGVPALHLLSVVLHMQAYRTQFQFVGLLMGIILTLVLARTLKPGNRLLYAILCIAFQIALCIAYLLN